MSSQTFLNLGDKASDLTFGSLKMRLALIGVLLTGAACAEVPPKLSGPDSCGAPGMQYLVGQNESVLAAMTFEAGNIRVIRPGMAVTQDYRPTRLNLTLDAKGRITRVYCG